MSKINVELKKGELSKYGYSPKKNENSRHRALLKSVKTPSGNLSQSKMVKTIKRLNVIATYTKNTQPNNSKKYKKDMQYMSKKLQENK